MKIPREIEVYSKWGSLRTTLAIARMYFISVDLLGVTFFSIRFHDWHWQLILFNFSFELWFKSRPIDVGHENAVAAGFDTAQLLSLTQAALDEDAENDELAPAEHYIDIIETLKVMTEDDGIDGGILILSEATPFMDKIRRDDAERAGQG